MNETSNINNPEAVETKLPDGIFWNGNDQTFCDALNQPIGGKFYDRWISRYSEFPSYFGKLPTGVFWDESTSQFYDIRRNKLPHTFLNALFPTRMGFAQDLDAALATFTTEGSPIMHETDVKNAEPATSADHTEYGGGYSCGNPDCSACSPKDRPIQFEAASSDVTHLGINGLLRNNLEAGTVVLLRIYEQPTANKAWMVEVYSAARHSIIRTRALNFMISQNGALEKKREQYTLEIMVELSSIHQKMLALAAVGMAGLSSVRADLRDETRTRMGSETYNLIERAFIDVTTYQYEANALDGGSEYVEEDAESFAKDLAVKTAPLSATKELMALIGRLIR
jgi:hypothetical protein